MRSSLYLTLIFFGLLGTIYSAWSWNRVSERVIVEDRRWPRSWPYPDEWISALEPWFDARNPVVAKDSIKLHGEFGRVRFLIAAGLATCLQVTVAALLTLKSRGSRGCRELDRDQVRVTP